MGNFCKNFDNKEFLFEIIKDLPRNEFKEIVDFKKKILNINIFKRKSIALDEYNKYIKESTNNYDIKEQYVKIIYLVLLDDTNKEIIKLYLNFLKKFPDFIHKNNLLSYEEEINKYKIIYSIDEMNEIEKNIKMKSEKEFFIDYIKYLARIDNNNISELKKFYEDVKTKFKKIYLFNNPIDFNNKELFYYKCYYNLLSEIYNSIENEYFLLNKKKVIEYVIKRSIFTNIQIENNEDKMNLLNLYILKEDFGIDFEEDNLINFNRLIQPMPITKEDFFMFNKNPNLKYKNKLIKNNDNEEYIEHQVKLRDNKKIFIPLEKVCINNLNNTDLDNVHNQLKIFYLK